MAEERLLAVYADARSAARAIAALRERGLTRIESFSPLPDPQLQAALAARPSAVRAFTLAGGVLGCGSGLALTIWTSLAWPLMTGGKPIVSLPPFIVIGFETTILLGALITVLGMFLNARLPRLGKAPGYDPRFSNDKFGIVAFGGPAQLAAAEDILRAAGADEVNDV